MVFFRFRDSGTVLCAQTMRFLHTVPTGPSPQDRPLKKVEAAGEEGSVSVCVQ